MLKQLSLVLICVSALSVFGHARSAKYQSGTITAVTKHQNASGDSSEDVARYDVSVKIDNVLYTILYTPLHGANSVEYSPGIQMLFSVGGDTLTFNSKISGTTEVPIVRREVLPASSGIDLSKVPSQYFTMKQQHLSIALALTEDQQDRIKPVLEQESAEATMILQDPILSRKDKLKRYEKVIADSDAKIKPNLSPSQLDKLVELRKQQKSDLKKLISKPSSGKQS